jgi:SAM-dependent MidA family methyltransferase
MTRRAMGSGVDEMNGMLSSEPITIEEFMRRALYDPRHGYYSRRIAGIGKHGDFTTAPMMGDALAMAIARWAENALRETCCRDLIEIGPGEGALAAAVWKQLPWSLRWRSRLHLVETSAPLREIQSRRLGKHVRWHDHPAAALDACGGSAVVFSNELVDAFPARVFEKTSDGWREMAVKRGDHGHAVECLPENTGLPSSSSFDIDHVAGQRVEIHESYHKWLESWLPRWRAGRMLTIDYGGTADSMYHRRPRGTLRGYLLHQRLDGLEIYQNPGRADLTADVNFTDLIAWSGTRTRVRGLHQLAEFMRAWGAGGFLTEAGGAGGAFMALDQERVPE